jgi:hypothetical protein
MISKAFSLSITAFLLGEILVSLLDASATVPSNLKIEV